MVFKGAIPEMKFVQNKLELLEREIQLLKGLQELVVSDEAAKEIIKETICEMKISGIKAADVIDLNARTRLPAEQISRVMLILEKEGIVSDG